MEEKSVCYFYPKEMFATAFYFKFALTNDRQISFDELDLFAQRFIKRLKQNGVYQEVKFRVNRKTFQDFANEYYSYVTCDFDKNIIMLKNEIISFGDFFNVFVMDIDFDMFCELLNCERLARQIFDIHEDDKQMKLRA